ncbi:hypothetical protein BaRGS_00019282 [Batillaria attramentaria]|uniref:Uncharacterized protein n=1 Tax=Batillaria attramentaria TaxID=370345 RepID=A0ABD0KRK7_9CAEN
MPVQESVCSVKLNELSLATFRGRVFLIATRDSPVTIAEGRSVSHVRKIVTAAVLVQHAALRKGIWYALNSIGIIMFICEAAPDSCSD